MNLVGEEFIKDTLQSYKMPSYYSMTIAICGKFLICDDTESLSTLNLYDLSKNKVLLPQELKQRNIQAVYSCDLKNTFYCTFDGVFFIFEVNLKNFSLNRKIKIPDGVTVNKIKEFNDEDGNSFLVIACQDGVLLTC